MNIIYEVMNFMPAPITMLAAVRTSLSLRSVNSSRRSSLSSPSSGSSVKPGLSAQLVHRVASISSSRPRRPVGRSITLSSGGIRMHVSIGPTNGRAKKDQLFRVCFERVRVDTVAEKTVERTRAEPPRCSSQVSSDLRSSTGRAERS